MPEHKVDLDSESVWLEQGWLTKPELVAAIKSRLESGNFAVATLSEALEQLDVAVRHARVLSFRVPVELANALTSHSEASGVPVGALLRHAVAQLLVQSLSARPATEAAPTKATPAAEPPQTTVTPEEQAAALPLRPKAITSDVERAWFRDQS